MGNSKHGWTKWGIGVVKLFDWLLYVLTFAVAVAMVLAYCAPYVHPAKIYWFAFLGLAAPFIYIANALLMLYWTVRWQKVALLSLAVFVLGLGHVGKYFRPQWSKQYEHPRQEGTLRILSYNVGGFWGNTTGKPENRMQEITTYITEEDPDIICFQEFETNFVNKRTEIDSLLEDWKYKSVFYTHKLNNNGGWGVAVYSKYPIVAKNHMTFPDSYNSVMWVDIAIRKDTIRVFNNHLQTTQINEQDREFLRSEPLLDTSRNDKAKGIARKLKRNFVKRAEQADSVSLRIHDGTPWVIVCGDFNDTPMSYTYRKMRGNFVDAFKEKGHGAVFTYRRLLGVLRIDYLFHSDDFETVGYRSEQPEWSDHNPVIVDVRLKHK